MRLRTSLSLLVVASVIPLAGFGLVVSAVLVQHEQDNYVSAVQARNPALSRSELEQVLAAKAPD